MLFFFVELRKEGRGGEGRKGRKEGGEGGKEGRTTFILYVHPANKK